MIRLILSVIILLGLFSCSQLKNIEPPETQVIGGSKYTLSASTINLPVSIELKGVYDKINNEVPKSFSGEEQQCDGVSYSYTFHRKTIEFQGSKGGLLYSVPGSYSIRLNYCPKCTQLFTSEGNCLTPRTYASCGVDEEPRKVRINYVTSLTIDESFQLISKTQLKEFKSLDPCEITVFNYNATERVEKEMEKALLTAADYVDTEIRSHPIQQQLKGSLEALNKPVDLGQYGKLRLNTSQLRVSPFTFEGTSTSFNVQLIGYPALGVVPVTDRVNYSPSESASDEFNITLPVRMSFDTLSTLLDQNIKGHKIDFKKKEIQVDSVSIYGSNLNKLNLMVRFSGNKKGTVYLEAIPVYSTAEQELSLSDIHLTLESKNVLLKSAKWLLNGKLESSIEEHARFNFVKDIDKVNELLRTKLNGSITPGLELETQMNAMRLIHLQLDSSAVDITIQLIGTARLKVSPQL